MVKKATDFQGAKITFFFAIDQHKHMFGFSVRAQTYAKTQLTRMRSHPKAKKDQKNII